MDDMTYEIDDKLVACPKCGADRPLDAEHPCERCWAPGHRRHTLAKERLQARAELFEALLQRALDTTQYTYDALPVPGWKCPHCGEITIAGTDVRTDTKHAPNCLVLYWMRALAPDADHAALLEEVTSDETD